MSRIAAVSLKRWIGGIGAGEAERDEDEGLECREDEDDDEEEPSCAFRFIWRSRRV